MLINIKVTVFVAGIAIGAISMNYFDYNITKLWILCRYVVYALIIRGIPEVLRMCQTRDASKVDWWKELRGALVYILVFIAALAMLLGYKQTVFCEDFLYIFLVSLIINKPNGLIESKPQVSYGVGMACSYFEGYLVHVIPSDGASFVGFEDNIRALEDQEGVLFPVKKLFIIITKSMYCPPDLKEFNKGEDASYLQAFNSLDDVVKSVAGVRNRTYRNTAYKIYRGGAGVAPVCLAAECATPLHTLQRALARRAVHHLLGDVDAKIVVSEFCDTLQQLIQNSPHCRGKCELVHYDDEDPKQNLAEILLQRIAEIEPRFEEKIAARTADNVLEQ